MKRNPMRARAFAASLVVISLSASACASDDASLPPTDVPLVVTAVDYGFDGLPERIAAGTTLTLENESMVEVHELVAIRLPDDEQRPIDELVQLPPEEFAAFYPLVETVIIAPPGEAGFAVEGTGTLDAPGRYAVICVIPTGAVPEDYLAAAAAAEGGPPQVAGGPPHIAMGMYGEVIVE